MRQMNVVDQPLTNLARLLVRKGDAASISEARRFPPGGENSAGPFERQKAGDWLFAELVRFTTHLSAIATGERYPGG